jgi:putative hydrolase of the HAD superfamily
MPVGLLTNATSRLPRDLAQLQLRDEFDVIINSAVVGAAKPSRAIFQAALAALQAQPATTLFVDDTPGHVQAAAELGMVGHIYRSSNDFQQLLAHYQIE